MKQFIDLTADDILPSTKEFIAVWKDKKKYPQDGLLSFGQCVELLIATTYNLHFEDSDGRFYNKMLQNSESVIGWDGDEPIDTFFYEVQEAIKKRLSKGGTFNTLE